MELQIYNNKKKPTIISTQNHSVVIGRNPNKQNGIIINDESISRKHIQIIINNNKLYLEDLGSRNGTWINKKQINPNQLVQIGINDEITLGSYEGCLKVIIKQSENSEQSSEQKQRSRQKNPNQILISPSTIKMIKQMTLQKKTKQQKIKFLKLMGHKNVEEQWEQIEKQIQKKHIKINKLKKTQQQLQKQFAQSRSTQQKKGLGSNK